jgi:hypothetical protein
MLGVILTVTWAIIVCVTYRKEFAAAWREAYPDGFGKNYPKVKKNGK